jgi:diguanylate cyclase (GGDEF)-like protein
MRLISVDSSRDKSKEITEHAPKRPAERWHKINTQSLGLALLLGIAGLLLNLIPIPLFANVQLILGNTAYLIVAILLGPWYALLSALLCALGLLVAWGTPHVLLLFPLEALIVGFAKRKNVYALHASFLYWVFIGMPLFFGYAHLLTDLPDEGIVFIMLKQGINGIFYASVAALMVILIPRLRSLYIGIAKPKRRAYGAQLTYLFTLTTTLALLIFTLVFNHIFIEKQQKLLDQKLQDTAYQVAQMTSDYIRSHMDAVDNAANWLSQLNTHQQQRQALLSTLHNAYPGFIGMRITDDQGRVTASSPTSKLQAPFANYFKEALYDKKPLVSPVFLRVGIGSEPILALRAPLYDSQSRNRPIGILEGSLNLTHFANIDLNMSRDRASAMVLLDDQKRVLYSSANLKLTPLTHFNFSLSGQQYKTRLPMINIKDLNNDNPEFVYAEQALDNGWHLYIFQPFSPLLALVQQQYQTTFVLLGLSLLAIGYIVSLLSQLVTKPLFTIAKHFSQLGKSEAINPDINGETPEEIFSLYQTLKTSRQELIRYQLELEEKVALRTHELELLNTKLQHLAERDPLTGLFNRRYVQTRFADIQDHCQRSAEAITVAILDLDLFKHINDTHGHLAGDECLKVLSTQLLSTFKRDTDLLCRYGGEEFLLILPLCNALKIEEHLNEFRERLARIEMINPQDKQTFHVTASIGAIIANASYSDSLEVWVRQADANLYKAKESGRNKVICTLITDLKLQRASLS